MTPEELPDQASIASDIIANHLRYGHADHKPHADCSICNFWNLNNTDPIVFENKVFIMNQEDIKPAFTFCDGCGKKILSKCYPMYDENYKLQHGLIHCGCAFSS